MWLERAVNSTLMPVRMNASSETHFHIMASRENDKHSGCLKSRSNAPIYQN